MAEESIRRRIDDTGFSGYRVVQNPDWFCYGVDAVLLADFARMKPGARAADLGTGTGIIPLILKHKYDPAVIYAVEVQPPVAALARETAELNGLEDTLRVIEANVTEAPAWIGPGTLDTVVTNPPYVSRGGGIPGEDPVKNTARQETAGTLADFLRCGAELLKERGDFYMIHRPARLADAVELCRKYRLEPKEMQFIQPRPGKAPNLFLLHCVKNGGPELRFLDPLCVYDDEGNYTPEILAIYER